MDRRGGARRRAVTLRPKQLVLATGMSGQAERPRPSRAWTCSRGDAAPFLGPPGPGRVRRQAGRGHRQQQLRVRHLRGAVGARRGRDHGAAVLHAHRQRDTLMDIGLGDLYSEQAVAAGVTTEKADLIFASIPTGSCTSSRSRCTSRCASGTGLLRPAGEGRVRPRLGRGRIGPVHEVPAPRLGLLHRRGGRRAGRRRRGQAGQRPGGPPDRGRGRAGRRHRAAGRPGRLRHRLRLDERLGRRPDLPGGRRPRRQGVGPRLGHHQGPRPVGGRAAQHVEADPAAGAVVPRREPAPVTALLASTSRCS